MAIAGEIEPVSHAIFADTRWEPTPVYEHMQKLTVLAEDAGIQVHIVSAGDIRADALDASKRFASMPLHVRNKDGGDAMARRQCTNEYKLQPILKKERELAGLKKGQRCTEHRITTLIGISLDELGRMRDPAFPWIVNEYPLVDARMTRNDCHEYHRKRQLPDPPRSACLGCPYHSDAEWRNIKYNDAAGWADVVDFDERIRQGDVADRLYEGRAYLHSKRIPLSVVDFSTEEDRGQGTLFDNDCVGMCGL